MGRWRQIGKRRLIRGIGLFALFLLVLAGTWIATHWTFVCRLVSYPYDEPVTQVGWYTPAERIEGAYRATLPTGEPERFGFDSVALEQAAHYAGARNSAAFIVLRRGHIILEKYWRGSGPTTVTASFSMAKTLLALLIGTAVARNEIHSIDDPISRYVTEWRDQKRGAITLRQLLAMESGLEDEFWDLLKVHLSDDLLPPLLDLEPDEPPGLSFNYHNLNSQILALALERATHCRYAELLSERLWQPIGARDAAIWLDRTKGNAKVYCCVLATPRDWARVGELVRHRGRVGKHLVVSSSWFDEMETPSRLNPNYGLHIWQIREPDQAHGTPPYVYLDGIANQRVFVLRSLELVVVRVGEKPDNWSDKELLQRVVAAMTVNRPR